MIIHREVKISTKVFKRLANLNSRNQSWFNMSLGKYWKEDVEAFFIPKVEHLSTLIIIFVHVHHLAKSFNRIWFSFSRPVMTAASLAN